MLAALAVVLVGLSADARAYGPGVHVLEADRYAELYPEWADDEVLPFLRFGALFPDIRSAGFHLPISTHDKALGGAILEAAQEDGALWKQAFALGYQLHTASDTAAQVLYIPWLTAHSDLQLVNLWGNPELGPAGDNELLVEGYGDLHCGGLDRFVDTVWAVGVDRPQHLDQLVDLVVAGLAIRLGDSFDEESTRAELRDFWLGIEEQLVTLDPVVLKGILSDLETAWASLKSRQRSIRRFTLYSGPKDSELLERRCELVPAATGGPHIHKRHAHAYAFWRAGQP